MLTHVQLADDVATLARALATKTSMPMQVAARAIGRNLFVQEQADVVRIFDGKSAADLQLLRAAWREAHPRRGELVDVMQTKGATLSHNLVRLFQEQLLSGAESDVRALNDALGRYGENHVALLTVFEVLCMSLPCALIEMRHHFMHHGVDSGELVDALRRRLGRAPHADSSINDSAQPLLSGLIAGASTAANQRYTAALVASDAAALRAVIYGDTADVRRAAPEVRDDLLPLVTTRTKRHLLEVAAHYDTRYKEPLVDAVCACCKGDLLVALRMLFEPAERYYAHRLHAALYGHVLTPELGALINDPRLLRDAGEGLPTVARILARRFGRDLSGIAAHWNSQYDKSLIEVLAAKASGVQRKALLGLLMNSPAHDPNYQCPSTASQPIPAVAYAEAIPPISAQSRMPLALQLPTTAPLVQPSMSRAPLP